MRWQRVASHGAARARPDPDAGCAHRRALERGDDVVQALATAKYALTIGDTERAMRAIDTALDASRRTLAELLATMRPPGLLGYAGSLVRSMAAGSNRAEPGPLQAVPAQALSSDPAAR
jgi:hypothetical protein